MSEVEWRPIPGFEHYSASRDGQVRNKSGRVLKAAKRDDEYQIVSLSKDRKATSFYVHKLIASAFLENPQSLPEVDHLNRIRADNRAQNLEWVSKADNRLRRQLKPNHELKGNRTKVWKCDVNTGEKLQSFHTMIDAVRACGAQRAGAICNVVKGRNLSAYGFKWIVEDEDMKDEIWKSLPAEVIDGEIGNFISSEGRIRNKYGTIRNGYDHTSGYKRVCIGKKDYLVHRLVAQIFLPNFFGKTLVNHKDGNKLNPRLYNLEWSTPSENIKHAHETGLIKTRQAVRQFSLDGVLVAEYRSVSEAVAATGCRQSSIYKAVKNKSISGQWRWQYVIEDHLTELPKFAGRVRPIRQLSLAGVEITDFCNISKAAKAMNYDRIDFRRGVLRNKGVWAGFKWEFLT